MEAISAEPRADNLAPGEIEVIAASLGRRFSGINASMLALIPEQTLLVNIVALGFHIDGPGVPTIGFGWLFRHGRHGPWRIWHARRNIDMLAGLVLKHVFKFKLILVFTSAAQRHHTGITRFYYHRMEELIAPTSAAASFLTRSAVVVPHGVDTMRFFPPERREAEWAYRKLPGERGFGIFGRIRPNKGTRDFVEAAIRVLKKRPGWTAVIIGETTSKHRAFEHRLRSLAKAAGLEDRIVFAGFEKDPSEIPKWYRALSIVVCASHTEGFGLPCLEAMASGCAVVATRTGAWPEIIEDGKNGFLIPVRDSASLATVLGRLADDALKRAEIGQAALETVRAGYTIQKEAEGIQSVYNALLRDNASQINSRT